MKALLMLMSVMMLSRAGAALAAPADRRKPAKPQAGQARQASVAGIRTVLLPSPANPLVAIRLSSRSAPSTTRRARRGWRC